MASELSRLIDDELEKVERGTPARNEGRQELRTSLRIKTSPQKSVLEVEEPPTFRQRAWWSWKRIGLAAAVAVLFFSVLFLAFGSSSNSSPAGYKLAGNEGNSAMHPEDMFGAADTKLPTGESKEQITAADEVPITGSTASQGAALAAPGLDPSTAAADETAATPPPPTHKQHKHKVYTPKHQQTPVVTTQTTTLPPTPVASAPQQAEEVDFNALFKAAGFTVLDLSPLPGHETPTAAPTGAQASSAAPTSAVPSLVPVAAKTPQLAPAAHVPTWSMQIGRRMLL